MADNLIFPIRFDLEKGIEEASKDWEKSAKKLEKAIAGRPVKVKLAFDTTNLDSLDAVKKRLADLKIEPITPATKTAIKELAAELRTLAKALEAVQKYSSKSVGAAELRGAKLETEKKKKEAAAALAAQRAARAEYNLAAARDKDALAATRGTAATRNLNREYQAQDGYISRLIKRLAVYAAYRKIADFLTSVHEVTAEFELQRVSLGAIIQDQTRANQLFSEIKAFALTSPVSILDLTKYTKQLAAYKIGVDELFETTKRLTDISVGLGVSMERVVLAYGQTRATGYLRASEIRQFTEMGVPIVEELASKLSKMNGELVTAAQVMDMVSKRAISFELVKEVFDDMTSAGGMFYKMQEKQGNTLAGMWAKLGDAASMMYDEIGNTDSLNSAMKNTIGLLTDLMKNWREVWNAAKVAGAGFALIWSAKKVKGWQGGINDARVAASKKVQAAQAVLNAEIKKGTKETLIYNGVAIEQTRTEYIRALALRNAAAAELRAAQATTIWSKAWNKLKAAFLGNWLTLLMAGIGMLVTHFINANERANRLKNTLKEIEEESGVEQMKSVRNFESLANMAVQAADGSKKQKEALDELNRTYGDIIPQERLTIENLRNMKGNYDSLTQSIKDYVAEQMKQKQINAIIESTGSEMIEQSRKFQNAVKDVWSTEQIARFMAEYERILRDDPSIRWVKAREKALENIGVSQSDIFKRSSAAKALIEYADALVKQVNQVNALEVAWNNNYRALGQYGIEYEKLVNKIKDNPISVGGSPDIDEQKTPYLFKQQQQNLEILQAIIPTLKKIMSDANVVWQEGWVNIVETIDETQPQIISTIDFKAINQFLKDNLNLLTDEQRKAKDKLQEMYYNLGIPEEVVRYNRELAIGLANDMEDALSKIGDGSRSALDNVTKYFMQSGQSVNDYAKTLDDTLKTLKARIAELEAIGMILSPEGRKELEDLKTAAEYVERLRALISTAVTSATGRGATSDPRLGILQEMVSTLKQVNKEYDELVKKEGATKALADTQRVYADTFKNMQQLAAKYKFDLPDFGVPTDAASLTKYLKAVKDAMAKLPKSDKAVLALQVDIEKLNIDDMQKQFEKWLKNLSDKISRTKAAKEFYDKILSQTGDAEMAGTLTMNIYGDSGENLFQQTVEQLQMYFSGVEIDLPINFETEQINYKALRKIWETDKALPAEVRRIPEAYDSAIKQILDSAESSNQKMIEGWMKATEKAKTYGDKLADVYRTTATEIERIQKAMAIGDIDKGIGSDLIAGYKRKEAEEIAKLQYEAFKDSPMYVQMFDDLDHASTRMLENMKNRLIAMQGQWKNLDPTQLKELQSRLNEIDKQLAARNPFKVLANGLRDYYNLRKNGDARGNKSRKEADNDVLRWTEAYIKAQEELAKVSSDKSATQAQIAGAKQMVAYTQKQKEEAEKTAENWKKVEDAIGLSAGNMMQMLNWAGDIARAVADISEALGADEEDVQYWNTVADSLTEIAGGIQDIVQAAMSGNVVGIISATITAIPKMFVGFSNLFSAGKIRSANKEIKRQAELLERLEYTYGRLESAAEKLFGSDYINNFKRQQSNLEAQAEAYRKQADAERSKGKKADKDKIKEYENAYRDTIDKIGDMQGQLAAQMLGSDLTSAARDFAKAWLEAYKEFGNTADKMKEKFQDMIENMVVEGALAKVMERALQPMFTMIDEMGDQDFYSEDFWRQVVAKAEQGAKDADAGASALMKFLEKSGISIRELGSDMTGISRDIATASEESINGLSAHMNTVEYYVAMIYRNVADIAAGSGLSGITPAQTSVDYTSLIQQSLENQSKIVQHTAETVAECRNIAAKCQAQTDLLSKVIVPKGTATATHKIYVGM